MEILVLGGTRYFGKHMVRFLLEKGHTITIATRGQANDPFGSTVNRIIIERTDPERLREALRGKRYDVVCDSLAYSSNDVKYLLDAVRCDRYVMVSSTAVYNKHIDTREEEFDSGKEELVWCSRGDFPYDETKRQAENALWQTYPAVPAVAVRFPFVVGEDDYTNRLRFYVDCVRNGTPVSIDNPDSQMAFVRSDEAGAFLAFLAENSFCGAVNGSSEGTISVAEILAYIKSRTGKKAILSPDGEEAPYNGEKDYSINVDRAGRLDFRFTPLKAWIYDLLDRYMEV